MVLIDIVAWIISIVLFISFVFSLVALLRKPRSLRETESEFSSQVKIELRALFNGRAESWPFIFSLTLKKI
ncbi:hypothetical protein AWH48_01680 [Domibacillus aminovorans]|uniref:Uncharacterized protein n=1 Tax=Domibacillus aminovorans TaxID=29332 RepID=A0A177KXM7_9BACI|nr:hypothetical protein AWH48_01680 [Domibacillus aminovorans]